MGGSIGLGDTAGTMTISGAELQRMTGTGLTITNGSNGAINVDNIAAVNTANISGTITLAATTGTLGVVSFINNSSSFNRLSVSSDLNITLNKSVTTTVGALSFASSAGNLVVADGAAAVSASTLNVTAVDLNLNSTGALSSIGAMAIAEATAGASIGIGDTAGIMTISGAELQRMTASTLTINNSTNGAITVDNISALNTAISVALLPYQLLTALPARYHLLIILRVSVS